MKHCLGSENKPVDAFEQNPTFLRIAKIQALNSKCLEDKYITCPNLLHMSKAVQEENQHDRVDFMIHYGYLFNN